MGGNGQKKNSVEKRLQIYEDKLKEKSRKEKEINSLKEQIAVLQEEQSVLTNELSENEKEIQVEVYKSYTPKDLLKMATYIEKHAKVEAATDFRDLIKKFEDHNLEINDISNLQTYFKIYGQYVKEEHRIIKGLFGALGGKLDG